MPRKVIGKGIRFSLRYAPCAHICRYCLISESRKRSTLSFSRFEALVHRFYDWKQSSERADLEFGVFVGPSLDYDLDVLSGVTRLRARRGHQFRVLNLGGLRIRTPETLSIWLEERIAAGITGLHASFAGSGKIHDRWNGRVGDFDYQTLILRLGAERGLARHEKLFLTRNTLPIFDELLDCLDAIPGTISRRTVSLFFHAGLADRYEDERITEEIRDNLPDHIRRLRPSRSDTWLSEREWMPIMMETADQPRRLMLKLDVNETNIDQLEQAPCEETFAILERVYQDSYRQYPGLDELCHRYGDMENRRIYTMSRDVEGRWINMHARETGERPPID